MDVFTESPSTPTVGTKRTLSAQDHPRPRKRNATACNICRARKTKCDNKKPRCSYCESVGANCDESIPLVPDNQAILDRIDRLERNILDSQRHQDQLILPGSATPGASNAIPAPGHLSSPPPFDNRSYPSVENVLRWPIFEGQYASCLNLRELMTSPAVRSPEYLSPQSLGKGQLHLSVEIESSSRLVDNFFSRVHIKNPVLDEKEVRQWAKEIAFNGIGWDGRSCLVLLVCALGSISEPFLSEGPTQTPQSFQDSEGYQLAEAWFAASQKRIGTLLSHGGGTLEAQCFFFSAVYLMHTFRPFSAWPLFLQAMACCQMFQCFSKSSEELFPPYSCIEDGAGWKSDESMYWTCFKSELELRCQLALPSFNASNLVYPDFLPSPPLESIQHEDQAWYFYLAEIALRRLANKILSEVLPYSNADSICDLTGVAARIPDLEDAADQWSKLLPPGIDIHTAGHDADILRFILKGHLFNCYEYMYMPFVTRAINHPTNRNPSLDHLVGKALQICVDRIWVNEPGFAHRHHGTWGMMRACTRSALVLVAAKKCGQLDEFMAPGWEQAVYQAIRLLGIWRGESGDAESRKVILETAMTSLATLGESY